MGVLVLRGECYEGIGAASDAFRAYDFSRGLDIGNFDVWCGLVCLVYVLGVYMDVVNCFCVVCDVYV